LNVRLPFYKRTLSSAILSPPSYREWNEAAAHPITAHYANGPIPTLRLISFRDLPYQSAD